MSFNSLPANHFRNAHVNCLADEFNVPRRVARDIAMLIDPFKRPAAFRRELNDARLIFAAASAGSCAVEIQLSGATGF
ncbi:MAG: hypothetical protein KJN90_00450 [Gammaproteobacteria bacterium]|nr:hypothetical protein [Gammaproteobacteria bacterium]